MSWQDLATARRRAAMGVTDDLPSWASGRRTTLYVALTLVGVLVVAVISVGIGSVSIPPLTTLRLFLARLALVPADPNIPASFEAILFQIRLPRVALVALTGAALASSGTAYQGLFRNPLADPYLIGVAAGAGLGAVVMLALRLAHPGITAAVVPVGAFATALLTVGLVYLLGRVGQSTPTTTIVLSGVAVSAFLSAITTFLIMRMGPQVLSVLSFLLGGYGNAGWDAVGVVALFFTVGFTILWSYARQLNVLLFDEEQAQNLGIAVERVKLVVIVAATLNTAAAVSFSGLIGFVGLIVPHTTRLLVGPDHRHVLPLATLGGAGFLMLADLVARTVVAPEELPLGVVTAFAGAPFFLYVLRRVRRAAFV